MARNGSSPTTSWWSSRWFRWLKEASAIDEEMSQQTRIRGLRIQRLEVQVGLIEAKLRDRDLGECRCRIVIPPLDDDQWQTALDALSEQALYAAQLLAGDMPPEIETVFQNAGLDLLPPQESALRHSCDCCADSATDRSDGQAACRPLRALYAALGEMLGDDPWLLFRLRGCERQQLLAGLRERRSRNAGDRQSAASPTPQAQVAEEPVLYRTEAPAAQAPAAPVPLESQLETFWGSAQPLSEFHHYVGAPAIDLVALRRLGAPPFRQESEAVYASLSAIYRRTTDAALAVAYAEESGDEVDEGLTR